MSMETRGLRLTIILGLIVTVSAGCASSQGFNRAAMIETLHVDPTPDQNNEPLANQSSRLSTPFRLGIFFEDHNIPAGQSIRKVEWLSADRSQLLREFAPLQDEQILTDTFVLMDATLRGDDIRGIRQAGARYGADLVLIVRGAAAVDRYNNRYALLYPTLIGAYLAPGTESDGLLMVTGSLWAVRSEWHAPIQTVEGASKVVGSALLVDDSTALQEAKERAIQAVGMRIVDQLPLLAVELSRAKPNSR
jgi:rhombotail lipoprotein